VAPAAPRRHGRGVAGDWVRRGSGRRPALAPVPGSMPPGAGGPRGPLGPPACFRRQAT
jgi:hypothetical protein